MELMVIINKQFNGSSQTPEPQTKQKHILFSVLQYFDLVISAEAETETEDF